MEHYIDNVDFWKLEAQKYFAPPSSWSEEKRKDTATSRIFSGDWWGAQKRDGAFYKFIKDEDGNMYLIGRSKSKSGDYLDKIDWVPQLHPFFESLPNGTCLLGELYLPRDEQAKATTTIMNCLKDRAIGRQKKEEDKLHYYIFDILADKEESLVNMKAIDRFLTLDDYSKEYTNDYIEWAHYTNGKELWDNLQNLLAEGYEGVVITRGDAPYQPGKRPSKDCLKVKKELQDTIDCIIIGANPPTKNSNTKEPETWPYWYDETNNEKITTQEYLSKNHITPYVDYSNGKAIFPVTKAWYFGWAGSLKLGLYDNEKIKHIGDLSGISDEIKMNWRDYMGTVVEVSCMQILDTGGLRHPKAINFNRDKNAKECTMEQIL